MFIALLLTTSRNVCKSLLLRCWDDLWRPGCLGTGTATVDWFLSWGNPESPELLLRKKEIHKPYCCWICMAKYIFTTNFFYVLSDEMLYW